MTEPTTEARREWDRLIDRFMDFAEYRLPDGETAIRRSMAQTLVAEHRPIIQAAIEAEARASTRFVADDGTEPTTETGPAYPCINCGADIADCSYDRRCCDDSDHPYATFAEMRNAIEAEARAALDVDALALALAEAGNDDYNGCTFEPLEMGDPDHHGPEFAAAVIERYRAILAEKQP